jgi:tRNA dimethylallyltransferase
MSAMSDDTTCRPIVILGPTAGGKSDLAVELAERVSGGASGGGEVIGADSMQVYRHMDAGTAKPPKELRDRVPHHLVDIVEPTERFTVADWLGRTEALIADLQANGKTPVIVGGTNLYLKALLEGMFEGPGQDEAFRASLEGIEGPELHKRVSEIDPEAAERIAPNDRKRLVRALEVHHLTGETITSHQQQWVDDPDRTYRHDPLMLGMHWPVEAINPRINLRVKAMFFPDKVDPMLAAAACPNGESLPDETRRLYEAGLLGEQAREALGYKQIIEHLEGHMTLEEAFERTKVLTRRFAKQQRTWLRRFQQVSWLPAEAMSPAEMAQRALNYAR